MAWHQVVEAVELLFPHAGFAKLAIHWIIAALVVIAAFAFNSGPVLVLGDKTVVVLDVDIQPLLDN
jgi:hypothetical protein